ncbi:MAG: hypothetical protein MZV63_06560 [Marinilabiliales bacterium]|nr:hypothetical protein [Marinilabiliales bacterium]
MLALEFDTTLQTPFDDRLLHDASASGASLALLKVGRPAGARSSGCSPALLAVDAERRGRRRSPSGLGAHPLLGLIAGLDHHDRRPSAPAPPSASCWRMSTACRAP